MALKLNNILDSVHYTAMKMTQGAHYDPKTMTLPVKAAEQIKELILEIYDKDYNTFKKKLDEL